MNNYIINSFFFRNRNTLMDIYNYIKIRYDNNVEICNLKIELNNLKKQKIIFVDNNNYELLIKGNVVLNDCKNYYSRLIVNFLKTYKKKYEKKNNKKYQFKEIRSEQNLLRNYLINNKKEMCIICERKLPLCLLEAAHIKPRNILNNNEQYDNNIVEFMCRYCHKLYDEGFLSVYKGLLKISPNLNNYDLDYKNNKQISSYNSRNEKYFMYHHDNIYNTCI